MRRVLHSTRIRVAMLLGLLATPLTAGEEFFLGVDAFPIDGIPGALRVDDFNGDGRADAAVLQPGATRLGVLLGDPARLFATPIEYEVGSGAVFLASGDLDGDGDSDIVAVSTGTSTLSTLLNDGEGRFDPPSAIRAGIAPRVVELADFNGDDHLDAVTTDFAAGQMLVFLGDGTGGFPNEGRVLVGDNPHHLAIADFDRDGAADVAVAHSGALTWFRGLRDGAFERREDTPITPDPRVLTSGDFDADGRPDLGVITDSGEILCLENSGGDVFIEHRVGVVPGFSFDRDRPSFLVATDFDRDGKLDIVSQQSRTFDAGIRVLAGMGGFDFSAPRDIFFDAAAADFAFEDLDLDGLLDAIVTQPESRGLGVYRGIAPGQISGREVLVLQDAPRDLVAADVDDNGVPNLIALVTGGLLITEYVSHRVFEPPLEHVFPGRAFQRMTAADFDGDGRTDLALTDVASRALVVVFLGELGSIDRTSAFPLKDLPGRLAAGDLDGDEFPDVVALDQIAATVTLVLDPGADGGGTIVDIPVSSSQLALALGDADGDGATDIAVSTRNDLRIHFGGPNGFQRSVSIAGVERAQALVIADTDADGANELAVLEIGAELAIFDDLAAEAPTRSETVELRDDGSALVARDLDGDGHLELLVAGSKTLSVVRGSPESPRDLETYVVGASPRAVVIADVDGDGLPDAATPDFGSESLSVLVGSRDAAVEPRLFLRGDTDGDGTPSLTDAVQLLDALFLGGEPIACADAADADDDGSLSLTDAIVILDYLFRGGRRPPEPGPERCGRDPTPDSLIDENCEAKCE